VSSNMETTKRRWFLPDTPDVLGMLGEQAKITVVGMEALGRWAGGEAGAAEDLREAEHRADDAKRTLRVALTVAFTTPIDAEDLYTLSALLDEVVNGAKDAVRESEVMDIPPDEHLIAMTGLLTDGVRHLASAFELLAPGSRGKRTDDPTVEADAAVKAQRQVERVYRQAMSTLLGVEDLREVVGRRELYRRFSRISDGIVATAERVWYAFVKES
jgi:uncharacterized protein Yka (UPF0111/DUF47 family)